MSLAHWQYTFWCKLLIWMNKPTKTSFWHKEKCSRTSKQKANMRYIMSLLPQCTSNAVMIFFCLCRTTSWKRFPWVHLIICSIFENFTCKTTSWVTTAWTTRPSGQHDWSIQETHNLPRTLSSEQLSPS